MRSSLDEEARRPTISFGELVETGKMTAQHAESLLAFLVEEGITSPTGFFELPDDLFDSLKSKAANIILIGVVMNMQKVKQGEIRASLIQTSDEPEALAENEAAEAAAIKFFDAYAYVTKWGQFTRSILPHLNERQSIELLYDRELITAAVTINAAALTVASLQLQSDPELVQAAAARVTSWEVKM